MSKAEEKAIEAYPIPHRKNYSSVGLFGDAVRRNDIGRIGFTEGYGEGAKDMLEKARYWLSHKALASDRGIYFTMSDLEIERFRKEMEKD